VQRAVDAQIGERHLAQPTDVALERHRQPRNDRDAETQHDGILDGFGAAEDHVRPDIDSAPGKRGFDHLARSRAGFAHDERNICQLGSMNRRDAGKRAPGRMGTGDQDHLVVKEDFGFERLGVGESFGQSDVELAFEHVVLDRARVADPQIDRNVAMAHGEVAEDLRDQIAADGRAGADREVSAMQAEQLAEVLLGRALLGKNSACTLAEHLAGGGCADASRKPVDQPRAERRFELGELPGNRRLADAKSRGRTRDRPLLQNLAEYPQMIEVERHDLSVA